VFEFYRRHVASRSKSDGKDGSNPLETSTKTEKSEKSELELPEESIDISKIVQQKRNSDSTIKEKYSELFDLCLLRTALPLSASIKLFTAMNNLFQELALENQRLQSLETPIQQSSSQSLSSTSVKSSSKFSTREEILVPSDAEAEDVQEDVEKKQPQIASTKRKASDLLPQGKAKTIKSAAPPEKKSGNKAKAAIVTEGNKTSTRASSRNRAASKQTETK